MKVGGAGGSQTKNIMVDTLSYGRQVEKIDVFVSFEFELDI